MKKKENIILRSLKGLSYGLAAWLMCLVVGISSSALVSFHFMFKFMTGLCTAAITLGLYFNWTYYACKRDKDAVKFRSAEYDRLMPVKMAAAAPAPSYIMLAALYLMKLGIIKDRFAFYLFFNIWIKPFADMFAEQPLPIESVPWVGVLGITFLILLQPAVITATYLLTYHDIDVYKLLFFNNKP
ncbi:MAG: hypothetical protein FWG90_12250 [Oscillospiraceae bacterium]|nr:hypothetical protein [Oscillospiraceae bacterium]